MAVQPLPAPFDQRINSPNRRYYVLLSARNNRTAAYDGVNLIPANYDPNVTMLTFYRRGNPFRSTSLQELVPDLSKLQPTPSHVYWGYYTGFENGLYRVDTVDCGTLRFDPKTGDLVQHKQANR
jgi:hypothetical protein